MGEGVVVIVLDDVEAGVRGEKLLSAVFQLTAGFCENSQAECPKRTSTTTRIRASIGLVRYLRTAFGAS